MIDLEFDFAPAPWEELLQQLPDGGSLSAVQFLTWLEEAEESDVEAALSLLEEKDVLLEVSDLPKPAGTGEAALRLRREAQLGGREMVSSLDENDPLRLYLDEVESLPRMDAPIYGSSDPEAVTNGSLYRVVELAFRHTGMGVLLLDLIQEGSLGLWQAVSSWQGQPFAPYRDRCILSSMAKLITLQARAGGTGQRLRQAMEDYRSTEDRLLSELGRGPTLDEMAQALHMSPEEVEATRRNLENARLQNAVHKQQPQEEEPEDAVAVEDTAYFQTRQRIAELLSGLPEEDVKLLSLRFGLEGGLPLSPEDTGKRLGLTAEEVTSREAAALQQLRKG